MNRALPDHKTHSDRETLNLQRTFFIRARMSLSYKPSLPASSLASASYSIHCYSVLSSNPLNGSDALTASASCKRVSRTLRSRVPRQDPATFPYKGPASTLSQAAHEALALLLVPIKLFQPPFRLRQLSSYFL